MQETALLRPKKHYTRPKQDRSHLLASIAKPQPCLNTKEFTHKLTSHNNNHANYYSNGVLVTDYVNEQHAYQDISNGDSMENTDTSGKVTIDKFRMDIQRRFQRSGLKEYVFPRANNKQLRESSKNTAHSNRRLKTIDNPTDNQRLSSSSRASLPNHHQDPQEDEDIREMDQVYRLDLRKQNHKANLMRIVRLSTTKQLKRPYFVNNKNTNRLYPNQYNSIICENEDSFQRKQKKPSIFHNPKRRYNKNNPHDGVHRSISILRTQNRFGDTSSGTITKATAYQSNYRESESFHQLNSQKNFNNRQRVQNYSQSGTNITRQSIASIYGQYKRQTQDSRNSSSSNSKSKKVIQSIMRRMKEASDKHSGNKKASLGTNRQDASIEKKKSSLASRANPSRRYHTLQPDQ